MPVVNVFRRHGAKNGILPKIRVRSLMLWMLYLTRYRPWMTYRNPDEPFAYDDINPDTRN